MITTSETIKEEELHGTSPKKHKNNKKAHQISAGSRIAPRNQEIEIQFDSDDDTSSEETKDTDDSNADDSNKDSNSSSSSSESSWRDNGSDDNSKMSYSKVPKLPCDGEVNFEGWYWKFLTHASNRKYLTMVSAKAHTDLPPEGELTEYSDMNKAQKKALKAHSKALNDLHIAFKDNPAGEAIIKKSKIDRDGSWEDNANITLQWPRGRVHRIFEELFKRYRKTTPTNRLQLEEDLRSIRMSMNENPKGVFQELFRVVQRYQYKTIKPTPNDLYVTICCALPRYLVMHLSKDLSMLQQEDAPPFAIIEKMETIAEDLYNNMVVKGITKSSSHKDMTLFGAETTNIGPAPDERDKDITLTIVHSEKRANQKLIRRQTTTVMEDSTDAPSAVYVVEDIETSCAGKMSRMRINGHPIGIQLEILLNFRGALFECHKSNTPNMPPKKSRATGATTKKRKQKEMEAAAVLPQEEDSNLPARSPLVNYAEDEDEDKDEEEEFDPEDYWEPPLHKSASSSKHIRTAIAVQFEYVLDSPPESLWTKLKTITTIAAVFPQADRRAFHETACQVCRDVLLSQEQKGEYTGEGNHKAAGRPSLIDLRSVEAEIIADALESRNSITMSTYIVNQYRQTSQLPSLTHSAVKGCMYTPASDEVNQESHPMFLKLLGDAYNIDNPPACYNVSLLTPLLLSNNCWLNELHKKAHIGASGSRFSAGKENLTISFKRDANGRVGPNGIPRLKQETFDKLQLQIITLVKYMKALDGDTDRINAIIDASCGISYPFIKAVEECLDGDPPTPIDHQVATNPYKSQYGGLWEAEIDQVCMTGQVCVADLIDYMFEETRKVLRDSGFLFHNHALSLMTSVNTVAYLKEKGDPPVGKRLETNPLDTSLFSQLHRAVDFHVHISSNLPDDMKFSKVTPSALSSAYKQVWMVHPWAETIAKEINKVLRSFHVVAEHEGLAVDGFDNRNKGRRYIPKKLHEDAASAPKAIVKNAQIKFETAELDTE
eukprot:jgi/Psemu1/4050/gm1.4050_g